MRPKGRSLRRNLEVNQDSSPQHARAAPLPPKVVKPFMLSPGAIFITDPEGLIRGSSPQSAALFGFPQTQLFGTPIEELIPESFPSLRSRNREGQTSLR